MNAPASAIWWQGKPRYINSTVAADEAQIITADGDSEMADTFGIFYGNQRTPTKFNFAVPGDTILDISTPTRKAQVNATLSGTTNQILLLWCGTNSIALVADTVAGGNAVWDQYAALGDYYLANGWGAPSKRVYLLNSMRRGDNPAGYPQVAWAQFNLRCQTDAAAHSSGPCIDMTGLPGTPGDNRNYEVDKIHYTAVGSAWFSSWVINPFLYSVRF